MAVSAMGGISIIASAAPPAAASVAPPQQVPKITQAQIDAKMSQKFVALCADYEARLAKAKAGDVKVLDSGFWYTTDYFDLMQKYPERNNWLIEAGHYYHGMHPFGYFTTVDSDTFPTGKVPGFYVLQQGIKPSVALRAIKTELCFIDCSMAYQIAFYEVLLEVWGQEKFDEYFSNDRLALSSDIDQTPLADFLVPKTMQAIHLGKKGLRDVVVGRCYEFLNHRAYRYKDPNGTAQSFNVVCVDATRGHQRFTGLGLPAKGVDEDVLFTILANEFNKTPYCGKVVTKAIWDKQMVLFKADPKLMKLHQMLADTSITAKRIEAEGGGFQAGSPEIRLDADKVNAMVK